MYRRRRWQQKRNWKNSSKIPGIIHCRIIGGVSIEISVSIPDGIPGEIRVGNSEKKSRAIPGGIPEEMNSGKNPSKKLYGNIGWISRKKI